MERKTTFSCRRGLICLLLSMFVVLGFADLNYPDITYGDWEDLAPGARIRSAHNPDPTWNLWVLEVDMDERNIDLVPSHIDGGEPTSVHGEETGAVASVNAGFFNMETGEAQQYLEIDGNVINSWGADRSTFGLSGNKREHFVITQVDIGGGSDHPQWDDVIDAIGGGPNLVTAGEEDVIDEGFPWVDSRHPRTAVGYKSEERLIYFVTVDGRNDSVGMTIPELADFFLDLGCDYAMNYDGGGSTTMWADGEVKNAPSGGFQRSVPTVWNVVPRYLIDWDDAECEVEGDWQTVSRNDSYYRDSLEIQGGELPASVTYTPDLARAGLYEIFVWYPTVQSPAEEVPFTIHDALGSHSVTVDQSEGSGEWTSLGMYSFEEGTEGSLVINNIVDEDYNVTADSVYFHYRGDGLGEYIIDNQDSASVEYSGGWWTGDHGSPWDDDYHIITAGDGSAYFRWFMTMPYSGLYEVSAWWAGGGNRETDVRYEIEHGDETEIVYRNQREDGAQWNSLGEFHYQQGETGAVTVTNHETSGDYVEADAVKFTLLEIEEEEPTSVRDVIWTLY